MVHCSSNTFKNPSVWICNNPMKILAISDKIETIFLTASRRVPKLKGIELILACGDLPASYMEFLVTVFNVPLYYVLGNHDRQLYRRHINGCTCIDETTVLYKGKIIGGLSGSINYSKGELKYSEVQMHGKIARLFPHLLYNRLRYKRYVDILITHSPILGIHDEPTRVHRGFKALRLFDKQYRPAYHIHGHTMIRNNIYQTCFHSTQIINTNPYRILNI